MILNCTLPLSRVTCLPRDLSMYAPCNMQSDNNMSASGGGGGATSTDEGRAAVHVTSKLRRRMRGRHRVVRARHDLSYCRACSFVHFTQSTAGVHS
jgi:hypothetical protein